MKVEIIDVFSDNLTKGDQIMIGGQPFVVTSVFNKPVSEGITIDLEMVRTKELSVLSLPRRTALTIRRPV